MRCVSCLQFTKNESGLFSSNCPSTHYYCGSCVELLGMNFTCFIPTCRHNITLLVGVAKEVLESAFFIECNVHKKEALKVCFSSECAKAFLPICESCDSLQFHKQCQIEHSFNTAFSNVKIESHNMGPKMDILSLRLAAFGANIKNRRLIEEFIEHEVVTLVTMKPGELLSDKVHWIRRTGLYVNMRTLVELEKAVDNAMLSFNLNAIKKSFLGWNRAQGNRVKIEIEESTDETTLAVSAIKNLLPGQRILVARKKNGNLEFLSCESSLETESKIDTLKNNTGVLNEQSTLLPTNSNSAAFTDCSFAKTQGFFSQANDAIKEQKNNIQEEILSESVKNLSENEKSALKPENVKTSHFSKDLSEIPANHQQNIEKETKANEVLPPITPSEFSMDNWPEIKPFSDSKLLDEEKQEKLARLLTNIKVAKLAVGNYGFDQEFAPEFHKICDSIPNTVIVCKFGEFIAGGFSDQNWGGKAKKASLNSYLFSLNKSKIYKLRNNSEAIVCKPNRGPSFGGELISRLFNQEVC